MTETQISHIKRFLGDKDVSTTIKNILASKFLSHKGHDVNLLASQTLAYQLLDEAWQEMELHRQNAKDVQKQSNIGV
jgi:hypothetical protein